MLFTPFPLQAVDFLWLLSLRKRKLEISQKWKHGWFLHKRSICTSLGREAASEGQDCSYKGGLVLFWKGGSHFGLSLGAHLCVIRLSSETFFFPPYRKYKVPNFVLKDQLKQICLCVWSFFIYIPSVQQRPPPSLLPLGIFVCLCPGFPGLFSSPPLLLTSLFLLLSLPSPLPLPDISAFSKQYFSLSTFLVF